MPTSKQKEIKLSSLLKEKFIILELEQTEKKEVMLELVELIAKSNKLKNKKAFSKAILEREKLGSTGIGAGLAIPHAKSENVRGFILVFGRKSVGIDFGALDGEKTYLFFALASPKVEIGGHLKILAEISRLVKDKFIIDLLRKAKTKEEILKIIVRSEKHSSS